MKLLLMADGLVGKEITCWLLEEYPQDIAMVVAMGHNEIFHAAKKAGVLTIRFHTSQQVVHELRDSETEPDIGVLAWWPKIIREPLLSLPKHGFINTHPSLLPHNRGKHYNFWVLVEQAPFGVSLHFIDDGIDSGDIVAQKDIRYDWEDNGATLYAKAQHEMISLFRESYPIIRTLDISRRTQDLDSGSFHTVDEIDRASRIDIDAQYRARDLLNLLRARTFPGYPACWFSDGNEEYEVRIEITKRKKI